MEKGIYGHSFDTYKSNHREVLEENKVADDIDLFISESVIDEIISLEEAASSDRKKIKKDLIKCLKSFFISQGLTDVDMSTFSIGGANSKFMKGEGDTFLIGLSSKTANAATMAGYSDSFYGATSANKANQNAVKAVADIVNSKKSELKKEIKDATGVDVKELKVEPGRMRVINLRIDFDFK